MSSVLVAKPVFLQQFNLLVQEVELLDINPTCAYIRIDNNNRESSMSLHNLTLCPSLSLLIEKSGPDNTAKDFAPLGG